MGMSATNTRDSGNKGSDAALLVKASTPQVASRFKVTMPVKKVSTSTFIPNDKYSAKMSTDVTGAKVSSQVGQGAFTGDSAAVASANQAVTGGSSLIRNSPHFRLTNAFLDSPSVSSLIMEHGDVGYYAGAVGVALASVGDVLIEGALTLLAIPGSLAGCQDKGPGAGIPSSGNDPTVEPGDYVPQGAPIVNLDAPWFNRGSDFELKWRSQNINPSDPAACTLTGPGIDRQVGASGSITIPAPDMDVLSLDYSLSCLTSQGRTLAMSAAQARAVKLSWKRPTQYTNNSPLPPSDIAGYQLFDRPDDGVSVYDYNTSTLVTGGLTESITIDLPPGSRSFVIRTLDVDGVASGDSNEASKTIY